MLNSTGKKVIALSIDVEDWFTVRNMRDFYDFKDWAATESRLHIGLNFILEELDKRNIKATFFVLGWVADVTPDLVRSISRAGHEIGSHGYTHTPIDLFEPESFEQDLVKSLDALYKVTGKKVKSFRAPSFSITKKTYWALDILKKHGILYDSSIFSITHPDYGINDFPTRLTDLGGILEMPMRKSRFWGLNIPVSGGGYFRMLPYCFIKSALLQTLKKDSVVMYFHPWEFDPDQPRIALGLLKRFRHYVGLSKNRDKFIRLLSGFEFTTIEKMIELEMSQGTIKVELASNVALTTSPL